MAKELEEQEEMTEEEAVKFLVTRLEEISDQVANLRDEATELKKVFAKKHNIDNKTIGVAVSAAKRKIDGDKLNKYMEYVEPIVRRE